MSSLWLKARRCPEPRQQCELARNATPPCCFDIGLAGDWRPAGLSPGDSLRITFDGRSWCARLLSGDLSANGLHIIGDLVLYAPMVLRMGGAYFFVDDVPDRGAHSIGAALLAQRHAESMRETLSRKRPSP